MGALMMIVVAIQARRLDLPTEGWAGWEALWRSFLRALLPLLAPAIIIGGMWSGVFTPTEAAAVAALYAILITMAVYRELDARQLFEMVRLTMRDTAVVLIIVAAAALYAWFLVFAQIPQTLVAGIRASISTPSRSCSRSTSSSSSSACSWRRTRPSPCSRRCCSRSRSRPASTRCISASS